MHSSSYEQLAIVERGARYENDRILGRLRSAAADTPYRFVDFRSGHGRQDLIAIHQFLGQKLDGRVLSTVRDLLCNTQQLASFIVPGTSTFDLYRDDLRLLAEALRRG